MPPPVLDYSGWRPNPLDLKAAGVTAVCRYLAPLASTYDWKRLSRPEDEALRAVGLAVVGNWEQNATSWRTGYGDATTGGYWAGQQARAQMRALGRPDSVPVAFSIDSAVQDHEMQTALAWMRGCVDGSATGKQIVYGTALVIDNCWNAGLVFGGWQPIGATSWHGNGYRSSHNVLIQHITKSYPQFPNSYDENTPQAPYFGQYPTSGDTMAFPPYMLIRDTSGTIWCVDGNDQSKVPTSGAGLAYQQSKLAVYGFSSAITDANANHMDWLSKIPDGRMAQFSYSEAQQGRVASQGALAGVTTANAKLDQILQLLPSLSVGDLTAIATAVNNDMARRLQA